MVNIGNELASSHYVLKRDNLSSISPLEVAGRYTISIQLIIASYKLFWHFE